MGTEKKRIILLLSKYLERDDIRDIEGLSVDPESSAVDFVFVTAKD